MTRRPLATWLPLLALLIFASAGLGRAQPLPLAPPEEVGLSSERLQRIGQTFRKEIEDSKLPGAVVMVARKGRLAYLDSSGFEDKQAGRPMRPDAIFRIYSMTKPLVSVAAMILVEQGRLQLTDGVAKYLPEFEAMRVSVPFATPLGQPGFALTLAERGPTVQDLLRHTAGLAYGEITANALVKAAYAKAGLFKPDFDYNVTDLTPEQFVHGLATAPLAYQPGTVWEYSLATDLLGRVIEKVSGQRLADFMAEQLFRPLHMPDSGFFVPAEQMGRLAQPLPIDPASGNPNRLIDVSRPPSEDSGGAGGVATAGDYLRFGEMLLEGGKLDGVRVLSRTSVELMASDQLGPHIRPIVTPGELLLGVPGYTFGLGFAIREQPGIAGIPGSEGEFTWGGYAGTFFFVDPKEELVAVMMTQAPGPDPSMASARIPGPRLSSDRRLNPSVARVGINAVGVIEGIATCSAIMLAHANIHDLTGSPAARPTKRALSADARPDCAGEAAKPPIGMLFLEGGVSGTANHFAVGKLNQWRIDCRPRFHANLGGGRAVNQE